MRELTPDERFEMLKSELEKTKKELDETKESLIARVRERTKQPFGTTTNFPVPSIGANPLATDFRPPRI